MTLTPSLVQVQERRFDEQVSITALPQDVAALELAYTEAKTRLAQAKLRAHGRAEKSTGKADHGHFFVANDRKE